MNAHLSGVKRFCHTVRGFRRLLALGGWATGLMFLGACGGGPRHHPATDVGQIASIKPPWFLVGPVNVLLTNAPGYGGHLVAFDTRPSAESSRPIEGELLCRGPLLLFVPDEKKHKHGPELGYIWDVQQRKGYVFSEGLQGYAPLQEDVRIDNAAAVRTSKTQVTERLDGHLCHIENIFVATDRGGTTEYRVCRAPDLRGLPLEIRALVSTNSATFRFSEVRLEVPGTELFEPPEGFTAYPTVEALANELLARSPEAPRRRSGEAQDLENAKSKHNRHDTGAR